MNRRHFIASSFASALAWKTLPGQAPAAPQIMPLGYSLYGMKSLGLREALEACGKIGYDAVELALMSGYHADPGQLDPAARRQTRMQLQDLKLTLSALMENLPVSADDKVHQQHLDRLKAAGELGHALSPDAAPVIETILGGGAGTWDKTRDLFARRVADWAKVAQEQRTIVCVKPHRSNAMNLPEQTVWLINEIKSPWIRLAYDYSHFEHRNLTMAETMKPMIPESRFVHVKDCKIENGRMQFLLPGDGQVDYVEYLRQLKGAGYRGCVCVEVSGMVSNQKGYDPLAAARKCYENLAPAFEKAEVRRKV